MALERIDAPEAQVHVSAVSALEIATKFRIGKLPGVGELIQDFEALMREYGLSELAITVGHARAAGLLDIPHRDPFDRLLIAQARMESLVLVSNEGIFDGFGVSRLW